MASKKFVLLILLIISFGIFLIYTQNSFFQEKILIDNKIRVEVPIKDCMEIDPNVYYNGYLKCDSKISFKWYQGSRHGTSESSIIMSDADLNSIIDLGSDYALDINNVYYRGIVINEADPATFYRLVYKDSRWSSTHPRIHDQTKYSMDQTNIFYKNQTLINVKPSKFKYFGNEYSGGEYAVYYKHQLISELDPNSFKVLGCDAWYTKDKKNVYIHMGGEGPTTISNANPRTFEIVSCYYYSRDSKSVFYLGEVIPDADPATFEVIPEESTFAKDANYYYSGSKKVTKDFVKRLTGKT